MNTSNPSVAVIGAGIIGLSTAYELALRGAAVTIFDRQPGPEALGASEINAGMIVPSHFVPMAAPGMILTGMKMMLNGKGPLRVAPSLNPEYREWIGLFRKCCTKKNVEQNKKLLRDLHLASRQRYIDWQEELGGFKVTQNGLFMICRTESLLKEESEIAEQAKALGLGAEIIDQAELSKREPDLDLDALGAIHHLNDAHFDPIAVMKSLRARLISLGVQFKWGAQFTGLQEQSGRASAVQLADGSSVPCDAAAICLGSWAGGALKALHASLPMAAGKGYSFTVPEAPKGKDGREQRMRACALLMEARVAVTPMDAGLRFAGTMEISPPEPGPQLTISRSRVQGILQSIPAFMPAYQVGLLEHHPVSAGLRPLSPDGIPYVGRIAGWENVSVAAGHGMMGMSLGPVTGRLLSQAVLDGQVTEPGIDSLPNLSPSRFSRQ